LLTFSFVALIMLFFGINKHQPKLNPKDIKISGTYLIPTKKISDFNLVTKNNINFTKENLKGRWSFLFFGFSNCGVVCPTTMTALNKMYKILEATLPQDKLPQIVMVTVDPERDTIKRMHNYVTTFNPNFLGATGKADDLINLQKQLHILAVKVPVK